MSLGSFLNRYGLRLTKHTNIPLNVGRSPVTILEDAIREAVRAETARVQELRELGDRILDRLEIGP